MVSSKVHLHTTITISGEDIIIQQYELFSSSVEIGGYPSMLRVTGPILGHGLRKMNKKLAT